MRAEKFNVLAANRSHGLEFMKWIFQKDLI